MLQFTTTQKDFSSLNLLLGLNKIFIYFSTNIILQRTFFVPKNKFKMYIKLFDF